MSVTEKIGLTTVTVKYVGTERDSGTPRDSGYRPAYDVTITTPEWQYVDNTLRGGVGERPSARKAFGSLLSFLLACVESQPEGENADLFPAHVAEWADQYSYELNVLNCDYDDAR